ncbi:MAG: hypothetical protein KVP17_003655 [Porospora cf. gigantea B]|nr:MAG: hypothetical protein KVP17_003655 [Porospora cf. gigantea B]
MALLNILERQRNSVAGMLSLRGVGHDVAGFDSQQMSWKVLIYDQKGQEILSTLMKVGSLRQHGVTLHMSIDSHRDPISDVPAAYFIEPTEKNLQRLEEDILHRSSRSLPMYRQFYVNFIRPVSSLQLETLARNTSAAGMHTLVSQVVDRYTDFVAIGAHTFHLNQPGVFKTLMSHGADLEVEAVIERITVGLESVCRQLTIMPVILCPLTESSPAKVIASRLAGRLRDAVAQAPHMQQWKMVPLVVQDRIADLVPMLQHGWSYQTLLHDVFGLHLNRVTVPGADGGKDSVYDVDGTDAFWVQYQNLTFPETATAVDTAMKAFNEEHHKVRASSSTNDLSAALNALPEITEKGRLLMKHTSLASSLLQAVKDRRLDE